MSACTPEKPSARDSVPLYEIVGNSQVRKLCGGITRHTLIRWRESEGFPEPLPAKRAGVELWDARAVRLWMRRRA